MLFYRKNFKRFRESRGLTQEFIARQLGVSKQAVQQWEDGKAKPRSAKIKKLAQVLGVSVVDISDVIPAGEEHGVIPAGAVHSMRHVPVISFSQVQKFEPSLAAIHHYAGNIADEHALFHRESEDHHFGLKVEGDSLLPLLPHGSVILVGGGDYPRPDDIVVAKLRTGEIVVRRYDIDAENDLVRLHPLHGDEKHLEWNYGEDSGFVQWMHPALEANIKFDLR